MPATQLNPQLPVAILAGGLATRLRPLTERIPKVLIEVAGRPFLEHQLAKLRTQGIRDVVLCVGYLGESVQEQFGDGSQYGMRLRYSFDGPALLGTGGAIRRALPLLGEAFFVLYGDSYLEVDFHAVREAFFRSNCNALMTVFRNRNQWDTSNVACAGGRVVAHDKKAITPAMEYIDYGLSVFRSSVFARYQDNSVLDLAGVTRDLALQGELAAFEVTERFYEIGSQAGLAELNSLLAQHSTL